MSPARRHVDAACPLRPSDPCTLCQLDVTGPQDCPLVYLARSDDEIWALRRTGTPVSVGGRGVAD